MRLHDSRQDNAVVGERHELGNRSISSANGNHVTEDMFSKCKNKKCKTCPNMIFKKQISSNITNQTYPIINHSNENINCHSQNLVYILTCQGCNQQYVGETTIPLHKRINIHRTSKTGCEIVIKHFDKTCKAFSFTIQVLEILPGSGYNEFNEVDEENRKLRLEKEDIWMKKLRTIYPYGLNERAKQKVSNDISLTPVGSIFPSLRQHCNAEKRYRGGKSRPSKVSANIFFDMVDKLISNHLKQAFNAIRKSLNNLKKSVLKQIAYIIMSESSKLKYWLTREQLYLFILDIIDTKLYKPSIFKKSKIAPKNIISVFFDNKAMEKLRLSKIFNSPEIIQLLPLKIQAEEHIPVVSYKLCGTIRNKILNYKETVSSIYVDEDVSFVTNSDECNCQNSVFCDPFHKHIVTGDLRIVENKKLRCLLTKGPNFREQRTINFSKCLKSIISALKTFVINMISKYNLNPNELNTWKDKIIDKIKSQIDKNIIVPEQTKPILNDPIVIEYLKQLQDRFVIVPIDKAANNFSFICKKYYVSKLLEEVGIPFGDKPTYKLQNVEKESIIQTNTLFCEKYKLAVSEDQKTLPIMYWIPKMHKNPVGTRFIVASSKCSTKPLSKAVSKAFKLIFNQMQNFHDKSKFYSNYKKFWVIENSFPIVEKLNKVNLKGNAKCISTFDFSTLYTKIEHQNLLKTLFSIIDLVFSGGTRTFIGFSTNCAFWTNNKKNEHFTKSSLKNAITHLITQCYFTIGNCVLLQTIGIPMGIDPAPFWANLHLHKYEGDFINKLIHSDKLRARKYHGAYRFIDDQCCINDSGDFGKSFREIYPPELELKVENQGNHATFLDLDITIVDGLFVYKLFDKRDAFPFFIVRMPNIKSNIPAYIFYGTFLSEILRIARCTLNYVDFLNRASLLYKRMVTQGGSEDKLAVQIRKANIKHPSAFLKYKINNNKMITDIKKSALPVPE